MKLQVNAVAYAAMAILDTEPLWRDARLAATYVAGLSAIAFFLSILHGALRPRLSTSTGPVNTSHKSTPAHTASPGGITIFGLRFARTLCVLVLLALHAFDLARKTDTHASGSGDRGAALALALTLAYVYASTLALAELTCSSAHMRMASPHLTLILLTGFAVYAYRNVWPLMTYTLNPVDSEGALLWVKITLLGVAGIVIPLITPRRYIPVDPERPTEKPNPEQTCSPLSLLLYSFLDKTVYASQPIPGIADCDRAKHLVERNFKYLDVFSGAKRRHVFFALMVCWEYISLAFLMVLRAIALLLAPVDINRLLAYLESDGDDAVVRPWVWCLVMFLDPFAGAIVTQYSNFVTTATLVCAKTMLTQLIFENALRMRVKSEPASSSPIGTNKNDDLSGKLNNLVTSDLQNVVNGRDFLVVVIFTPTTVAISLYFLYGILGWSAFVALAVMLASLPLPFHLTRALQTVHRTLMQKTDARVQIVSEMTGALKMVKMFGWERKMAERLEGKREDELRWLRWSGLIELGNDSVTLVIPVLQMTATYVVFTVVMGGKLTPSIVFPSMSVFMLLRQQIGSFFYFASPLTKTKVSLDRITDFLRETELLDQFTSEDVVSSTVPLQDDSNIGIRDASFTWSTSPSPNAFTLRVPGSLTFERGKINIITGPTGCGKTSLLMVLLGEMHFAPLRSGAQVSLSRSGGVAYAAQESWVMSGTIRDNILFGAEYDEARYKKVIYQCALKRDLTVFPASDRTEVDEKGQTLSGGQKARITLARAIYSSADVLLLDDVLAVLDVHTARWIVGKCLKGALVRVRTVLLVTQNIALVGPIANFVVAFGAGGEIVARGFHAKVLSKDPALVADEAVISEEVEERDDIEGEEEPETEYVADGTLVVDEVVAKGHISSRALMLFWTSLGGDHPVLFWFNFVIGMLAYRVLADLQPFWMGCWADAYGVPGPLMDAILGTTLRWVDSTPSSRIITRCTKDIKAIDGQLAFQFKWLVSVSAQLIVQLVAVVLVAPAMLLPGLIILALGAWVGNVYMKNQLPVKREMSNKKAPVLGHFSAAIAGLLSIRAYGAQEDFRHESYRRIDEYTRVGRTLCNLSCWVSLRSDTLGALLSSTLGAYMVYGPGASTIGASNAGFALAMATTFSQLILWLVRVYNDFEVEGNSLERIQAYLEIEQEQKPTIECQPPASWPSSGELHDENLSARYFPDGPEVLHGLNFNMKSGERVGIVGRTGSGKSSLTLSLPRCIFTEGNVRYDGVETANLNPDELRAKIVLMILREEFDRAQAAILEIDGGGLGLLSWSFEGAEDWFGGRIQIITAPPPPADATQKRKHYEPPLELFARKFVLMGRVFIPFDAKDGHVYAVETDEDYERDPIPDMGDGLRQPFWEFIKKHNPLALNYRQALSKWATRFDLGLSTSIPVLEFDEENIDYIEDVVPDGVKPGSNVPTEQKMTDGIGFMNGAALSAIARRIHLANRPGAVQGRVAGSKGLWLLHPTDRSLDEPPRVWIRRSQQKIILHELSRADRIFALVQPSRVFTPGHLGMQPILNLAHNGVPASAFEDLMGTSLRAEAEPFTDWTRPHAMPLLWAAAARAGSVPSIRLRRILPDGTARAMGLAGRLDAERSYTASGGTVDTVIETESQSDVVELDPTFKVVVSGERGRGAPDNLHETVMELIQAGFTPQESGYLHGKVRFILKAVIEGYVSKYRILVPRSAEAYIVADPFGYLAEDEVHFRSSKELGDPLVDSDPFLVTGDVLISRYPTTVASDIRKARAVTHPAYESYVDMIILPIRGPRSFASWLGGGDYDGDMAMITWEPTLVEPFKNAPQIVEPAPGFIEKNFDSSATTVQDFVARLQGDRAALGTELLETLLSGMRDRRVGLYARFHDLAIWRLGYGHPATERLAHMFVTCLDANKTGLRTLDHVFRADDLAWKLQNLPACMAPQVKGAYAGFSEGSPFILDLLRSRGQALENELLGVYDQSGLNFTRDDTLLEPAHRAELYARKMQRDLRLDLWVQDLDRLREFVDRIRKEWPSASSSSPRKPRSAEDRTASINALARRFEHDAPRLESFALYSAAELASLRASFAYAACPQGNETFAFAVAFSDLCRIKASADDAAVIVRSIADVLTMQRSTRAALGGNVVSSQPSAYYFYVTSI
ncbi:unnamed protein product [Peniophora sp. CBMAI 1063]|nr:unnamed protein product [Peniophora sp. CBMAI 1063]